MACLTEKDHEAGNMPMHAPGLFRFPGTGAIRETAPTGSNGGSKCVKTCVSPGKKVNLQEHAPKNDINTMEKRQQQIIAIMAAAMLAASCASRQMSVEGLRVEHMENPPVVDAVQPRLSWINTPHSRKARALRQTAYRIVVASSLENLKRGNYDLWDSGRQESSESNLIGYQGKPLASEQDCYWKVQTWDGNGNPSAWSKPSHWGMGLLDAGDWKAQWIAPGQEGTGAPLLRKCFQARGKIRQAKAYVCGLGYFELYVNGERIGEDVLVPNMTDYCERHDLDKGPIAIEGNFTEHRVMYLAYDVTEHLKQGENALGVILGNGFYSPVNLNIPCSKFGDKCLLMQVRLTYEDGTTQTIATDGTWQTKPSAITYNSVHGGELYNANLETPLWATVRDKSEGWESVKCVAGPQATLSAHTAPTDKVTERLKPLSLNRRADGAWEVDFGKEIAGWIHFRNLKGVKGDTLQVNYVSESVQGNQRYVFNGNGSEDYAPRFTWFVFSKAVITGIKELSAASLTAEAVNTDVAKAADFHTSDTLFNRINEIWQRSQLDNMHGGIASDCPHRERLPYTGDGEAACATVMHNFDAAAFYQKWIRDVRDAQNSETGYVPNSAPWEPTAGGGVGWGAAMNTMPWEFYVQYGDRKMLEDNFPAMKKQVEYMTTWMQSDGTMRHTKPNLGGTQPNYWLNLGDWCPPYAVPLEELVHTFFLWLCSDYTSRAAAALGQEADEQTFRALANSTRDAFHRKYYDIQAGSYGDNGCNIYALVMGGMSEARHDSVVRALRHEIAVTHGGHINTGFLATKFFFETLTDNELHDIAVGAMSKEDFPSYGHWIKQGATTTWEQWDGKNSHNHPMFGGGLTWFYRRLAGICADPSEPGYRHIILRPYPVEGLDNVHYSYRTPYGTVSSDLTQGNGQSTLAVTIPVGSHATLYLPAAKGTPISESGKPVEQAKGVTLEGEEDGRTVLTLQQGTYTFTF